MLPIDLVLVRHGQSEGNIAEDHQNHPQYQDFFQHRHNASLQLTDLGIKQSQLAGQWIKDNISPFFHRYYTSEYLRALATAAHLDLPGARWYRELYLRERDHGLFDRLSDQERESQYPDDWRLKQLDPLLWTPPRGWSIADLCLRIDRVLDTLHRECSNMKVIIVCHGEVMWAFRLRLDRLTHQEYLTIKQQRHPHDKINNCQVLHYSRRDPVTAVVHTNRKWVRSVCPWDTQRSSNVWQELSHRGYSNQELLDLVQQYPRYLSS